MASRSSRRARGRRPPRASAACAPRRPAASRPRRTPGTRTRPPGRAKRGWCAKTAPGEERLPAAAPASPSRPGSRGRPTTMAGSRWKNQFGTGGRRKSESIESEMTRALARSTPSTSAAASVRRRTSGRALDGPRRPSARSAAASSEDDGPPLLVGEDLLEEVLDLEDLVRHEAEKLLEPAVLLARPGPEQDVVEEEVLHHRRAPSGRSRARAGGRGRSAERADLGVDARASWRRRRAGGAARHPSRGTVLT